MPAFLRRRRRLRALVAIAAGCAFALQLLLTGIIVTQMAAGATADPFEICYGGSSDGPHRDGDRQVVHQACAICTIASFAAAPPAQASHAVPIAVVAAAAFPPAGMPSAAIGRHNPRSSQGPPRNA